MGVLRFVVAVCVLGVITLEGLNTTAALEAQKGATELVTHLGTRFSLDPKLIKTVVDQLPYLRFVALSALAAILVRYYSVIIALYVLLTRAESLCRHWTPVQKAFLSRSPAEVANTHREDLTFILTVVGTVAWLLTYCCSGCGTKACAPATQKGTHTVHK